MRPISKTTLNLLNSKSPLSSLPESVLRPALIFFWLPIFISIVLIGSLPVCAEQSANTAGSAGDATSVELSKGYKIGYFVDKPSGSSGSKTVLAVWYPASADSLCAKCEYVLGENRVETELALTAKAAAGKFPLVLYAHGAAGCGLSSFFLCEALARKGYVVVAPDFSDPCFASRIDRAVETGKEETREIWAFIHKLIDEGLGEEAGQGRKQYAYRPKQLLYALKRADKMNRCRQSLLYRHIDLKNVGVVGHSFGAWTGLLVSGAEPRFFRRGRIDAVVSLSGPVNERVFTVASKNDLALLGCPVMYQYGDSEKLFKNRQDRKLLYLPSNEPKALACIKGANHFTFSCGSGKEFGIAGDYLAKSPARETITRLTIAFLDRYLKASASDDSKPLKLDGGEAVSSLELADKLRH